MPRGIYIRTIKHKNSHICYQRGKESIHWKGNNIEYGGVHIWLRKYYGSANKCEMKDPTCIKNFHWSNKDHKYKRNIEDWQQLCVSHHVRYDRKKFPRINYNQGKRKYHNRNCIVCKSEFYPKKISHTFCSLSCSMTYRNNKYKE